MKVGGLSRLGRVFAEEQDRWQLWTPVIVGTGIAIYFGLPIEPSYWLGAAGLAVALVLFAASRARPGWTAASVAVVALCAGFGTAQLRVATVAAPALSNDVNRAVMTGRVDEISLLPEGRRIIIHDLTIEGVSPDKTPAGARIRVTGDTQELRPGMRVRMRADIGPPSPPVMPGAFDFQRDSYFQGIGAVGFAFGQRVEVIAPAEVGSAIIWSDWWAKLRLRIAEKVRAVLPGATGAIAVALVTGDQGGIPKTVLQDMRDSGLAHLLSISGLHIGLVAGLMFVGIRSALALVPRLALYRPIKKWAAAVALAGTFFYVLLAGATVPTQRAFVMTGLILIAVIFDRTALSMRTVAWAAMAVLLLRPEALVGPSFQMSFAAVVALIAAFEASEAIRLSWRTNASWPRRIALNGGGIAMTSLIATLATAPYAVFHFNRLAGYGVAANMLAVPITGLWVMAWAILAVFLMPFGLEAFALVPMGWGIDAIIVIAAKFAALPGAATLVPAMPIGGLIVITLGGLWLCLWRRPWRLLGAAAIVVGALSIFTTTAPDILISGDGRLFAIRDADGDYMVSSRRAHQFDSETWLRQAGQDEAEMVPWDGGPSNGMVTCDSLGCIIKISGATVAVELEPGALFDDCQVANLIISQRPIRESCPSAWRKIDRFDLWREGAHAIWVSETGEIRVKSVAEERGNRPWVIKPSGR